MIARLKHALLLGASALLLLAAASGAHAACNTSSALGVSRTVTIDTAGGKLYGGLQYGADTLLRDREVVLTFDDGPLRPNTRKVLAALASHCTKATFFMVGRMAVADPAMVREVAGAGHTVAHHTWSHRNLHQRSARSAGGEIELGISAVSIAAKSPTSPFFRFPYLADPNTMIAYGKERGLAIFSIDIDSYDYKTKSAERVFANIMNQLRARRKGIMLFHDIQVSTANAMQRLLDTMQREGFKDVHLVAKSPVATLAKFNSQAQGLHDKRRSVATAEPVEAGAFETAASARRRGSTKTAASADRAPSKVVALTTRSAPAPEVRTNPFAAARPSSTPAPASAPARSTDWRATILGTN